MSAKKGSKGSKSDVAVPVSATAAAPAQAATASVFAVFEPKTYLGLCICAAILGLSAPGLDQWYIAWFGLVPLFVASVSSAGLGQAFLRGWFFGIAYNLVYLNWYLGLQPLDWLNFNAWEGWAMAIAAWSFVANLQALVLGFFSAILSKMPMTGNFWLQKWQAQWKLPALLAVPLLWTLIVNFIGNAHCIIGVPWTLPEYSQYKQLPLIQIASVVGGVGLGFLIVMANTALATLYCTFQNLPEGPLNAQSKSMAAYQVVAVALLVVGCLVFGFQRVSAAEGEPDLDVTVLQGNINIEMQKTIHRYTIDELLARAKALAGGCKNGLLVWTESAVPTYLTEAPSTLTDLVSLARAQNIDMVVGSLDHDKEHKPYNSAFGIDSHGRVAPEAYHKRYLVPFGEYMPAALDFMPEWMRRLTNTPAGSGFASGTHPVTLNLTCGKVAPLICFETLSPEMVASSVRSGGQLLVNISDLAWFHQSSAGQQMIAFSVVRAIENHRYFVFAANTGPSAIIDARGRILQLSGQNREQLLTGKVMLSSQITPFTHWFVF